MKRLGYLRRNAIVSGSYNWTRGGKPSGWKRITTNLPDRYIELDCNYGDKPISYRVELESIPKYFGGCEWYFICPATGKRCRTLYGIGEYFLSRFAYPDAMYSKQTQSKHTRELFRAFIALDLEANFQKKRYARTMYNGKLTKRFERSLDRQERLYNPTAILRLLNR